MSAPVDVLAVLLQAEVRARVDGVVPAMAQLPEARAAVAELLARIAPVLEWCEQIEDGESRVPRPHLTALYAALARFGGAK